MKHYTHFLTVLLLLAVAIAQSPGAAGAKKKNYKVPTAPTKFTVSAKFEIEDKAAGLCFGLASNGTFNMWQFSIENGKQLLRPHYYTGTGYRLLGDVDLSSKVQLVKGREYTVRIEIDGSNSKTYLNNVLVDTRSKGTYNMGPMGIRQSGSEAAFFDDFKVATPSKVYYSDDFSTNWGVTPPLALLTGGSSSSQRLYAGPGNGERKVFLSAFPTAISAPRGRFDLEADMMIQRNGGGLNFGINKELGLNYTWNFELSGDNVMLSRSTGDATIATETDTIKQLTSADLRDKWVHVKIAVDSDSIKTFVNDQLIDNYFNANNYGLLGFGGIGFNAPYTNDTLHRVLFDNVKLTRYLADGTQQVVVDENFEESPLKHFPAGRTATVDGNRVLRLNATGRAATIEQLYENQARPDVDKRTFAINPAYDTWVCDDELGRAVATSDNGATTQVDSLTQFGIFYYTWHGQHGNETKDITKILAANPDNPQWGPEDQFHWGGEPALGYYKGGTPSIIARHIQWLVDAGIDYLFFDATNGYTYDDNVKAVIAELERRDQLGLKWPKLAFSTNYQTVSVITSLYNNFYSKPEYNKYWYTWEGKPLILTNINGFGMLPEEVRNTFTARQDWAWQTGYNSWAFLDNTPQGTGYTYINGQVATEQISVSTAEHPTTKMGKSYHNGKQPQLDKYGLCEDTPKGLFFNEQWQRAFSVKPPMVMITQWNEWMARRYIVKDNSRLNSTRPGATPKIGESYFVDVYNQEFSRDIEPSNEPLIRDNYYLQMVDNMRKYRGVNTIPVPTVQWTGNGLEGWDKIDPEFIDEPGDTYYKVAGDPATSANNDIVLSKVAKDKDNLYFYAKTREDVSLSASADYYRMAVLLNSDCDYTTGWNGYDYRIVNNNGTMCVEKYDAQAKAWNATAQNLSFITAASEYMVTVPKSALGMAANADVDFDFKWVDNIKKTCDDVLDFYRYGEVAPEGRFNYRYKGSALSTSGVNEVRTQRASFTATGNGSVARFSFTVPASGKVSLQVFNAAGQQAVAVSRDMQAGKQELSINLPAGIYVVKYNVAGNRGVAKLANLQR